LPSAKEPLPPNKQEAGWVPELAISQFYKVVSGKLKLFLFLTCDGGKYTRRQTSEHCGIKVQLSEI